MGDDPHAEEAWQAPYPAPVAGTRLWLWYSGTRTPLGIYTYEDDVPGVSSYELPANEVTRFARKAWGWAESLDDKRPGLGDIWRWTTPWGD